MVTEAGSFLRRMDSCVTQIIKDLLGPVCNVSKEEEEEGAGMLYRGTSLMRDSALLGPYSRTIPRRLDDREAFDALVDGDHQHRGRHLPWISGLQG